MKTAEVLDLQAKAMTEAQLQTQVLSIARAYGWRSYHTHDSRRSPSGFPDLVLAHARAGRLVFAELKRQGGRYQPGQREWLDDLAVVGAAAHHDREAAVQNTVAVQPRLISVTWRPTDLLDGTIEAALTTSWRDR